MTAAADRRRGPLARLADLLCPRPVIVSALDEAAQPGLVALNERMAAFYNSPIVAQYFSTAEAVNAEWSPDFTPHHHLHQAVPRGATVLDVGCGSAHPARHLGDRIGAYIGIDWSAAQVEANRQRWPQHTFLTGSVYDVPLPDNSADVVMTLYVIEHCVWPHRMLDEMLRLARPGGLVAVLTPPFRHRSYLKSFPYGLSVRPFPEKVRSMRVFDVLWHVYHHRVWYPLLLSLRYRRGAKDHQFLIFEDPVCLGSARWFPDADAVYISDTAEIERYLSARGAESVAHWPEWGYVLMRKARSAVPAASGL